jgi:hypothetical protein
MTGAEKGGRHNLHRKRGVTFWEQQCLYQRQTEECRMQKWGLDRVGGRQKNNANPMELLWNPMEVLWKPMEQHASNTPAAGGACRCGTEGGSGESAELTSLAATLAGARQEGECEGKGPGQRV